MPDKHLLRVDTIKTVGLVDAGANQRSFVLLAKRADPGNGGGGDGDAGPGSARSVTKRILDRVMAAFGKALEGLELEEEGNMDFDISGLSPEAQAAFNALKTERDTAVTKSEGLETKVTELETQLADATTEGGDGSGDAGGTPGGTPEGGDEVLKGASPEIQALFAKQAEALEAARQTATRAEDLAKSERELRRSTEIEKRFAKGGDLEFLPAIEGDRVAVMKALDTLPEDVQKAIGTMLAAASTQLKQSKLLEAFGKDGAGSIPGGDAFAKIQSVATDMRSKDPKLSESAALKAAMDANPELAREYRAEMDGEAVA